jgi:hypothetical protein
MQKVPGEVEHCLGRNSRENLKEEEVHPNTYKLDERDVIASVDPDSGVVVPNNPNRLILRQ